MGDSVTEGDQPLIWLTATALTEVEGYDTLLRAEGVTYTSGQRAMRRPHPAVQLRSDAWRRALAGLKALGLSPTDRGKVDVPEPTPVVDMRRYTK
jgi:phage terminase small subunit